MNSIAINIIIAIAAVVAGYLIGSIPTSVIFGKVFLHVDPRTVGSKNPGGTNIARAAGRKYGVLVIILDMIKSLLPVLIIWAICEFVPAVKAAMSWEVQVGCSSIGGAKTWYWLAGLAAAIGHCWPIFLHFKGGKAVAIFMGLNCLTSWIQFVLSGFSYLYLAKKTKFISLTSIIVSLIGTVVAWLIFILKVSVPFNWDIFMWSFGFQPFITYGLEYAVMNTVISVLLILRHSSNIKRLKSGTESVNPFLKENSK